MTTDLIKLAASIFFTIFLLLFFNQLKAQDSALGNWLIYSGNMKIASKWHWQQNFQYRSHTVAPDFRQLLVRNGIGYDVAKEINISIGYDYVPQQKYDSEGIKSISKTEHRIYQQMVLKQGFGRFFLKHRYRLEQRFFKANFHRRFRYALMINLPLNHRKLTDKTYYFSAYNEIYIKSSENRFDQNRVYGGIGYKLNRKVKFECGYLNQIFLVSNKEQLNFKTAVAF